MLFHSLSLCSRHNENKNFLVWVNEEDHMRIISMEMGGNMKRVFERFCKGLADVSVNSVNEVGTYVTSM